MLADGAAAVLVVCAVVAALLLTGRGADGARPGESFAAAAEEFHAQYQELSARLDQNLARAGDEPRDPVYRQARRDAREIADAFGGYAVTLREIEFPEEAAPQARAVSESVDTARETWKAIADYRGKGQMIAVLREYRPQIDSLLEHNENALRLALT